MIDVTPNIPEVVAEVRALFERYEQALVDKNVDVLDGTFWNSPYTIRYAFTENGYGFDAIHAHRVARPPGPGIKEKRIRLEILTLGRDLATVNLESRCAAATRSAARARPGCASPTSAGRSSPLTSRRWTSAIQLVARVPRPPYKGHGESRLTREWFETIVEPEETRP